MATCSDGPAARKSGIRDGGRYERKEKLLFEMWSRRWFVTQVVGEGVFGSVDRQRSGVHQRTLQFMSSIQYTLKGAGRAADTGNIYRSLPDIHDLDA